MESETQENLGIAPDVSSSDSLTSAETGTAPSKKKSKKKDQGSDVAFFASFPCMVIAAVAFGMTILGFIPMGYIGEFCASLRAQYILILLLCALPALFAPPVRVPMVIACALGAVINLAFVVPCMMPHPEPTGEKANLKFLKFRVLQLSIEDPSTKPEGIVEGISNLAPMPEIVCVTGVPSNVLLKLNEQMPPQYLHRQSFNRDDGYGVAIYSTVPLKGTRLRKVGPEKLPVVLTSVHFDYGWFRLIAFKVPEGTDGDSLEKRNEQLKATAQVVKGLNGRKIVVGNFNTTPYSPAFGDFLKEGDLQDSRIGVQPNWNLGPVDFAGVLHLPVDHMLITKNVEVLSRYVCQPMGLTHRPILGEFFPADTAIVKYTDDGAEAADEEDKPAPAAAQPAAEKPKAEEKKPRKRGRRSKD